VNWPVFVGVILLAIGTWDPPTRTLQCVAQLLFVIPAAALIGIGVPT
jgi:hypothetical protein